MFEVPKIAKSDIFGPFEFIKRIFQPSQVLTSYLKFLEHSEQVFLHQN